MTLESHFVQRQHCGPQSLHLLGRDVCELHSAEGHREPPVEPPRGTQFSVNLATDCPVTVDCDDTPVPKPEWSLEA